MSNIFVIYVAKGKRGEMDIIKEKRCRRCSVDLFLERGYDGFQIICLQCGATYGQLPVSLKEQPTAKHVFVR
jgi:hypothetical protein